MRAPRAARGRIFWHIVAAAAVLVGCLGLLVGVPEVRATISAQAEPEPLRLLPLGTYYDDSAVNVTQPGSYAIWATRPTVAPDKTRCGVVGPDGSGVPTTDPGVTIQWVEVATDDTLWTWTASFDASTSGRYRLLCKLEPRSIGQQYAVTAKPDTRLALRLWLERAQGLMVAALPAGLVIFLVLTLHRRDRQRD